MGADIFLHECRGKVFHGLPDLDVRCIIVAGSGVFAMTPHCVVRLQAQ
jgi:hypothetical protein